MIQNGKIIINKTALAATASAVLSGELAKIGYMYEQRINGLKVQHCVYPVGKPPLEAMWTAKAPSIPVAPTVEISSGIIK